MRTLSCARARKPVSFSRENAIAVVILLRVWRECRSGRNKVSNARSFMILRSGEGSTSFTNHNRANFSGEKKYYEAFRDV